MLNYRQEKSHPARWLILESLMLIATTIKLEILHKNHITIFFHFKTNHAINTNFLLNVWTQDAFWTFSSLAVTRLDASGNLRGQKNKNKKPRLKKWNTGKPTSNHIKK